MPIAYKGGGIFTGSRFMTAVLSGINDEKGQAIVECRNQNVHTRAGGQERPESNWAGFTFAS
jgi:hypothetical protein